MLAAVLFLPVRAGAVSARRAYAVDAVSGRVLYEKNPTERSLIASTTKIMTALIVCEQCNVLDRMRIPKEAVGIEGSSMYLKEGEILTLQELLYGMMLSSGNDAAVALAIYCGGTVEGFAALMNDKARSLGLTGTHFENPNGLDSPGHYSTAKDLGTLAAYAMENPIFYKTVSAKNVKVGERYLTNHNKLLWRVAGADGVKTGFTKAAGRILVSSATRDGLTLIAVILGAPSSAERFQAATALLDYGFAAYAAVPVPQLPDRPLELTVKGSTEQTVPLDYSALPQTVLLEKGAGADLRTELTLPETLEAPVERGQTVGTAAVYAGETLLAEAEVKSAADAPRLTFGGAMELLWQSLLGA